MYSHLFGATLLIAGCCIGAGIMGLPLITALAGFFPSVICLILSWLLMVGTGLLLAEICLWHTDDISFVSIAQRMIGRSGSTLAWIFFLFLFISLLVAYVAASGSLLVNFFKEHLEIHLSPTTLAILLTGLIGAVLFLGPRVTDLVNRLLMGGLIVTYCLLVFLATKYVQFEYLTESNWSEAPYIMPPFVISFGFHNLVPTLARYLGKDKKLIRQSILLGTTIPFIIYLVWEIIFLGMIPLSGEGGFLEAVEKGLLIPEMIKMRVSHPLIGIAAEAFAFFAIITSFIAVALSLTDFLADGLKISQKNKKNRLILSVLTLFPPLLFGLNHPKLFLTALEMAGGIAAMVLYGLLPVWMVWRGRYKLGYLDKKLLPIGKGGLATIFVASTMIIILTINSQFA